ncbi:hypothetical protein C8R45DRAFT_553091 [Mycena sanguinolenta]|nr:hypothetical protein C8R45DRAFT_553091 [Mycena sanguinolenta]
MRSANPLLSAKCNATSLHSPSSLPAAPVFPELRIYLFLLSDIFTLLWTHKLRSFYRYAGRKRPQDPAVRFHINGELQLGAPLKNCAFPNPEVLLSPNSRMENLELNMQHHDALDLKAIGTGILARCRHLYPVHWPRNCTGSVDALEMAVIEEIPSWNSSFETRSLALSRCDRGMYPLWYGNSQLEHHIIDCRWSLLVRVLLDYLQWTHVHSYHHDGPFVSGALFS